MFTSPDARIRSALYIIAEVARRPSQCALDAIGHGGVAAVEHRSEKVQHQIDQLLGKVFLFERLSAGTATNSIVRRVARAISVTAWAKVSARGPVNS